MKKSRAEADAEAEGAEAWLEGKPITANPYDLNEQEEDLHFSWNDGWTNQEEAQ